MPPSCPDIRKTYQSLLTLKEVFDMELRQAAQSGDFTRLKELRLEILQKQEIIESFLIPFEKELKLKEQYARQKEILEKNGLLETRDGVLGIEGIEGIDKKKTFYPLPAFKDILKELRKDKEGFAKKFGQGISEMRIEPFALPVMKKLDAYGNALKRHFREGKLLAGVTKDLPFSDKTKPLEDMHVWEKYRDADVNGSMVYDPETLAKTNHRGKTKKNILSQPMTFPGFKVFFVEEETTIPRNNAGGAPQNGRSRIEADHSSDEYLHLLKTGAYPSEPAPDVNPYEKESPLSIDDWLIHALTVLEKKNEVIDDYGNGQDSACLCPGSFFPDEGMNGRVSDAVWDRVDRQVYADRFVPTFSYPVFGFRASVRVG